MNVMPTSEDESSIRMRRLERRLTIVTALFAAFVLLVVAVELHDVRAQRCAFWTSSLFAREFNLPPPQAWPAQAVSAGIAPSADGNAIAFWLAPSPLQSLGSPGSAGHQVRLGLDASGNEELTFIDRAGRPRLRLQLTVDGTPSVTCIGPDGATTWSTPPTTR